MLCDDLERWGGGWGWEGSSRGRRSVSSVQFSSVAQSCPTLRPHESQHARPPCPSPTPGVHSNSCPSSQWCHPAISSSCRPLLRLPPIPPSIRVFSNESTLRMRKEICIYNYGRFVFYGRYWCNTVKQLSSNLKFFKKKTKPQGWQSHRSWHAGRAS